MIIADIIALIIFWEINFFGVDFMIELKKTIYLLKLRKN